MRQLIPALALVLTSPMLLPVLADDGGKLPAGPARAESGPADAGGEIAGWVRELSDDDYDVRKAAAEKLLKAGPAAADAVAAAADSDDIELPRRCVELLGRMRHCGDLKTEAAAEAALKRLTESNREFLAKSARQTLEEPAPAAGPIGPARAGAQIRLGGIVLQGGNVSISRRVTNGKQQTEVKTDEQTIRIQDDNGKDIRVEITKTAPDADGNPAIQTKEYQAADLAELKEKHPEAAQVYEQFGAGRIGARIGGRAALPQPIAPGVQKRALEQQIEQLDETIKRWEQRVEDGQMTKEQFERVRDALGRHKDILRKQLEQFEPEEDADKKPAETGRG
jgi:hypothetical protein